MYPGIQNSRRPVIGKSNQLPDLQYNGFYQWVALTLGIQAVFMYLPRLLWKKYEKEISKNLLLDTEVQAFEEDKNDLKAKYIIKHLLKRPKITRNRRYYVLLLIEALNLVNSIAQFVMMNYFLNMNFKDYGWQVLEFRNWNYAKLTDPMTKAFPKMAKCKYYDFGSSGSPQIIDHLCVLPYNVLNEKVYLFLWAWFQILIIFNLLNLFSRFLLAFWFKLRSNYILKEIDVEKEVLCKVLKRLSIGEWYILRVLSLNLDSNLFEKILFGLRDALYKKETVNNL